MEVSFNECFEQMKIHRLDVIYADSDWFIIPNRAYAFHIHFIKELGKFPGTGDTGPGLSKLRMMGNGRLSLRPGK